MSAAARTPSPPCSAAPEVAHERPLRDPRLADAGGRSTPSDTSVVDPHRVEDLVNRFIAGEQDALFLAPDAYYRSTGADAVDGAVPRPPRLDWRLLAIQFVATMMRRGDQPGPSAERQPVVDRPAGAQPAPNAPRTPTGRGLIRHAQWVAKAD